VRGSKPSDQKDPGRGDEAGEQQKHRKNQSKTAKKLSKPSFFA
jgi:hypothetical protein